MKKGATRLPEFPKEDAEKKVIPSNIRLEKRLWARLDLIARAEKRSRNEVVAFFLEWACDDYEQAQQRKRGK